MVINPLGMVLLDDGGVPRSFTATAREAISGGEFLFCSGAGTELSSGASSFAFGDLLVANQASGSRVNGLAGNNAGSNSVVTVYTRGRFIVTCEEDTVAGDKVDVAGAESVRVTDTYQACIGRALIGASSGGFVLVDLQV